MIYSAEVKSQGLEQGTWKVAPAYIRVDGKPAPEIDALSANGIKPEVGDIVLCVESINGFEHNPVRSFDDNKGACPVIIATFADLLTMILDLTVTGKMTLGEGSKKMVLGDTIKTEVQKMIDQLKQLRQDFSTWTPTPQDGGAALKVVISSGFALKPDADLTDILSENHKLD
jgi:hypothetical protein